MERQTDEQIERWTDGRIYKQRKKQRKKDSKANKQSKQTEKRRRKKKDKSFSCCQHWC